jgi:hypothetical protein
MFTAETENLTTGGSGMSLQSRRRRFMRNIDIIIRCSGKSVEGDMALPYSGDREEMPWLRAFPAKGGSIEIAG